MAVMNDQPTYGVLLLVLSVVRISSRAAATIHGSITDVFSLVGQTILFVEDYKDVQ